MNNFKYKALLVAILATFALNASAEFKKNAPPAAAKPAVAKPAAIVVPPPKAVVAPAPVVVKPAVAAPAPISKHKSQ